MTELVTAVPTIPRDRYGRPLVIPLDGGKPVAYTRCTTFVDCLDDKTALTKWKQRMVALGLASRPDLMLGVTATNPDDKRALDKFCEDAMEAAQAHAKATTGTALHALTERIDRGQEVGVIPDAYKADLDAYVEATKCLTATHIEEFCVLDQLRIGGTPDRVVKYNGKRYIADIKTGSIEWGALKIAMQLAVYARSSLYDHETGQRDTHGAELDRGLIIHLPAGEGRAELVWVDLLEGWNAVRVAKDVRAKRNLKYGDLCAPFNAPLEVVPDPEPDPEPDLLGLIAICKSADDVRLLWSQNSTLWRDEHTAAAKARIAELP